MPKTIIKKAKPKLIYKMITEIENDDLPFPLPARLMVLNHIGNCTDFDGFCDVAEGFAVEPVPMLRQLLSAGTITQQDSLFYRNTEIISPYYKK